MNARVTRFLWGDVALLRRIRWVFRVDLDLARMPRLMFATLLLFVGVAIGGALVPILTQSEWTAFVSAAGWAAIWIGALFPAMWLLEARSAAATLRRLRGVRRPVRGSAALVRRRGLEILVWGLVRPARSGGEWGIPAWAVLVAPSLLSGSRSLRDARRDSLAKAESATRELRVARIHARGKLFILAMPAALAVVGLSLVAATVPEASQWWANLLVAVVVALALGRALWKLAVFQHCMMVHAAGLYTYLSTGTVPPGFGAEDFLVYRNRDDEIIH